MLAVLANTLRCFSAAMAWQWLPPGGGALFFSAAGSWLTAGHESNTGCGWQPSRSETDNDLVGIISNMVEVVDTDAAADEVAAARQTPLSRAVLFIDHLFVRGLS